MFQADVLVGRIQELTNPLCSGCWILGVRIEMALLCEDPEQAIGLALGHQFVDERLNLLLVVHDNWHLNCDNFDWLSTGQAVGDADDQQERGDCCTQEDR